MLCLIFGVVSCPVDLHQAGYTILVFSLVSWIIFFKVMDYNFDN